MFNVYCFSCLNGRMFNIFFILKHPVTLLKCAILNTFYLLNHIYYIWITPLRSK